MPNRNFDLENVGAKKTPARATQSGTAPRVGAAGRARDLPARRPGYHAGKHTQEG